MNTIQMLLLLHPWAVGIQLRTVGNAAYVVCLPLLCQGSKWLNGDSVRPVFSFESQLDSKTFLWIFPHSLGTMSLFIDALLPK